MSTARVIKRGHPPQAVPSQAVPCIGEQPSANELDQSHVASPRAAVGPVGGQRQIMLPDGKDRPIVECVWDGERLAAIEVTCSCGQVTRLTCQYDKDPAESNDADTGGLR